VVTRWLVTAWGALAFALLSPAALATSSAPSTAESTIPPPNVEPDIIVAQVRQKLAQPDMGLKTEAADRAALAAHYAERNGQRKVPVHVAYFTAVADDNGTVRYFEDIYGHDERVAAALEGRPARLEVAVDRDPLRRK
jgi:hypothetical protein